jgi:prepilin-type N-terminal cleavage/methylation domain-containing protein
MHAASKHSGFTLVEVAIVLVIIALIVGGIMAGQSLIHNAQMQSVVTNVARYKEAIKLFKDKYKELPGDLPNATSFWGTDTDNGGTCVDGTKSELLKTATCNGDGDGFISGAAGAHVAISGLGDPERESSRAWQHLSNAGFIEFIFSGAGALVEPWWRAGLNMPLSELRRNGFTISYAAPGTGKAPTEAYFAYYRHVLVYGQAGQDYDDTASAPGLTGAEALAIDQKMDDGKPAKGYVLSFTPASSVAPSCASSADAEDATYLVTSTNLTCSLIFITGL